MSLTTAARPRGRTRMSLAIVAILGLLGLIFAPAAVAATTVTYNGVYTGGHAVWMNGTQHATSVFRLDVAGGGTLRAYCVDLGVPINAGDTYELQQLGSQVPNPSQVLWILQNSFPVLTLAQLSAASGVSPMDTATAVAGTQAALWHYTDGRTLDTNKNTDGVKALYAYLTGPDNVGASSQPAPSLSITPATTTALSGRVGPFTINWSGSTPVDLATNPAFTIFDAASGGSAVTTASDGDEVWVEVPSGTAPGDVVVTASGSAPVDGGWALVNPDRPTEIQKLAFAGVQTLTASSSATITVEPTPTDPGTTPPVTTPPATTPPATEPATTPPASTTPATPTSTQPGLAETGSSTSGLALAGVAALLLGAGAMVLGSTRRVDRRH
ncbi:thioester domain-containing protein [Longivirga aurantiaca]|uniref:Thioester domain-containing protein n=1 Tax=Longivirga aurantiaca TaxID=1837743 RepID=A0ABW1SX72_9ACTN